VSSTVEQHEKRTRESLINKGRVLGELVKVYASTLDDVISLAKEQSAFLPADKIEIVRADEKSI